MEAERETSPPHCASASPRLSVIIPVYNSAATLPACLAGLDRQTLPRQDFEILVVDNNSTDGSADIVGAHGGARLLHEGEQGAYAARNRALEVARGETLVFTDPDCVADPDWLEQIEAGLTDPGALIVIGPADAAGPSRSCRLLSLYERHKDAWVLGSDDTEAYYGHTNNMAVRRSVFEALGPFERRLRGGDTILVRRTADQFGAGSVRYLPQMRVCHLEVDGAPAYLRKVRTYAASSQRYRQVVPARPLTLAERLAVWRRTAREERLSPMDAARLLGLLALGMAHWRLGSLSAQRAHTAAAESDAPLPRPALISGRSSASAAEAAP